MLPVLIDEGLPPAAAVAFRAMRLPAWAIGDPDAPPRKSGDDVNVQWCLERGALLVTTDRGKGDRIILKVLASQRVHALFVYNDLRDGPVHRLVRALLCAEAEIDRYAGLRRGVLGHRLKPTGKLEKRT